MPALMLNGVNYSGVGGGGNANEQVLTWAEYCALTPEEKMNGTTYYINDINGDGQSFQPVIFSFEEREIGVWVDGKPLYAKTIYNAGGTYGVIAIAHNISNVENIVDACGTCRDEWQGNTSYYPLPRISSDGNHIGISGTNSSAVQVWIPSAFGANRVFDIYITLYYTKTTDQPGSGTWTPQGVPAVHYDGNEKVVGTWIDGSTIYERTLYQDLSGQAEHWYVYLDTLIDNINDYTIINFQGQLQFKEGSYIYSHIVPNYIGGSSYYYINRNNGRWYLYFHSGNATCDWGYVTATIRYVKKILGEPTS